MWAIGCHFYFQAIALNCIRSTWWQSYFDIWAGVAYCPSACCHVCIERVQYLIRCDRTIGIADREIIKAKCWGSCSPINWKLECWVSMKISGCCKWNCRNGTITALDINSCGSSGAVHQHVAATGVQLAAELNVYLCCISRTRTCRNLTRILINIHMARRIHICRVCISVICRYSPKCIFPLGECAECRRNITSSLTKQHFIAWIVSHCRIGN